MTFATTLVDNFWKKIALASRWEQRHKEGHYDLFHKHVRMFQDVVDLGKETLFSLQSTIYTRYVSEVVSVTSVLSLHAHLTLVYTS